MVSGNAKFVMYYILFFYHWFLEFKSMLFYPPASQASREVTNLTERKNPHTPVYGVKEFVCRSVVNLTPIISGLAEQNGLKKI